MEAILVLGVGGHAKTIVDTIERSGKYAICGFVDNQDHNEGYRSYKTIGDDKSLLDLYKRGIRKAVVGVGAMGNCTVRVQLYQQLKEIGYELPVIIDPTAVLAQDAVIGEGTYIGRNVVVNADTEIGKMCILNTTSVVEHDCVVGDFSHLAVASVVCGGSFIGKEVFVGANATVIQGCSIGDGCIVGAGSVVISNFKGHCTVAGIPARVLVNKDGKNE